VFRGDAAAGCYKIRAANEKKKTTGNGIIYGTFYSVFSFGRPTTESSEQDSIYTALKLRPTRHDAIIFIYL